ncbi:ubiquitin-associated and SH3 domain-containing protein B-like isoform X1 [Leucoraja erinacea]|uniref:ubiquitin-associated and SH3 domain-containing protein B-like isoform X1 n=1 Tax=Leucoraja erinaceus TaxID=7782 RepID=UPI0024578261|nr:ubiquitin-associated and SH3 domain-containing protein B-like isoform X1 [Leucoraja erinacea]
MATKEEMYSKVIPRKNRQNRPMTVKHGSTLEVFLSMGFPKGRALKALASTGGKSVQAACDWLFSHVDDPFLDDPLPREYVLYLRPTGPLANKLFEFWHQSRQLCGKNKAHNIFPHITLCQFFMCEDGKVEGLCEALQNTVSRWKETFPLPLSLELYTSSNFIGLFVEEESAEIIKKFAADFASEATSKADVRVEPHKKQLHVTLAYHFQPNHLTALEKLARGVDLKLGCDWVAALYSRDIRFANHETLRVMYPYTPQNDDELELVQGDFIFMSPIEQSSTSEGWIYGTSLASGCSGLLPENYIAKADECDTWVFHGSNSFLTAPASAGASLYDGGLRRRNQEEQGPGEALSLPSNVICQPMLMLAKNCRSSLVKRDLYICRHGERMDVVFGKHWISQCFDSKGNYIRSNLNMPPSLPQRSGGYKDYEKDAPITVFGCTQARLVGEALLESKSIIDYVYCSPSLRCVQTAFNILRGLQQENQIKLRVEPGLFEWTKWVSGNTLPAWMTAEEHAAANLGTDITYKPHIPANKLGISEPYETYISRSCQVMREILAECKLKGNNILIVAHASSLEACTRQLQGLSARNSKDFVQVVRKIPYLGFCACEELEDAGIWQLVDPPILPLTHGPNHSFSWRDILFQD